jgi:outer membrane murein-binding lipoprotein Lpp
MNACERAEMLLPEWLQGELEGEARAADRLWMRQHLAECGDCAGMAEVWRRLGELPEARPRPEMRRRFDEMLAGYQAAMPRPAREGWWARLAGGGRGLAWAPVAAGLLLAAGAGWMARGMRAAPAPAATGAQVAALQQEVEATRQMAALALLQQQSANDRLQGVNYTRRLPGNDPRIEQALLHSLEYDPSADVRLAAVDALARRSAQPGVRSALVAAFPHQTSPLVQVAMLDTFVETHDGHAKTLLEAVSRDPAYNPQVRQHAIWALGQPGWN